MTRAWAMALPGSTNSPPSEKESGVTLRMPMTKGRPRANSALSPRGADFGAVLALSAAIAAMACGCAVAAGCQARAGRAKCRSVADLERQRLGLADPARHGLFRRQHANQLARPVGGSHGGREFGGVAVLEFAHGFNTGGLLQLGIFLTDALDTHAVGHVGPAQQILGVQTGLVGKRFAALQGGGGIEQASGRPDPRRLEACGGFAVDAFDVGDGVGHLYAPRP